MTVLPRDLRPMLATAGALPDDARWAYEVKWDGVRVLAAVEPSSLSLTSRAGNPVTAAYPELAALSAAVDRPVLLDGEVVGLRGGRPDFGLLQARMHVRAPSAELQRSVPVTLCLFDVLHAGSTSLLAASYDERRGVLEALSLEGAAWQTPPVFHGDSAAVAQATRAQGMEGVVAKRRDSRYEPGRRSPAWVKHKHVRRTSAVVVGWQPGSGGRAGQLGSLLLGVHQAPDEAGGERPSRGTGRRGLLVFAGHVGTGFTAATLALLADRLAPLRRETPVLTDVPREHARTAVWVEPVLVVDVDYAEWTHEGRLRHPSYKGLRDDVDPASVVRE